MDPLLVQSPGWPGGASGSPREFSCLVRRPRWLFLQTHGLTPTRVATAGESQARTGGKAMRASGIAPPLHCMYRSKSALLVSSSASLSADLLVAASPASLALHFGRPMAANAALRRLAVGRFWM